MGEVWSKFPPEIKVIIIVLLMVIASLVMIIIEEMPSDNAVISPPYQYEWVTFDDGTECIIVKETQKMKTMGVDCLIGGTE